MKKLMISFLILLFATTANADHILKWDASTGATGYKVYFTDGTNSFQKDNLNLTEINLNVLNIAVGVAYTYHVTAYNECGESAASETIDFTRPAFDPGEDNLPEFIVTIPDGVSTITINRE